MLVYLIGNLNADNFSNYIKQFDQAENELGREGHNCMGVTWANELNKDLVTTAKNRLSTMLLCEAVFVLPGWQNDPVAQQELALACTLNFRVIPAHDAIIPRQITFFTPSI